MTIRNQSDLSMRELECLYWAARGKTSWSIAIILGISENTVIFHIKKATKKLVTNNRTEAVAKAIELGLLELS